MALNHESLMEQLTNVVNQLGHIRKQLQQEVQRSNTPADQAAALREENAQLRAALAAHRSGAVVPTPHFDTTAASTQAQAEAEMTSENDDETTSDADVKPDTRESSVRAAVRQQAALTQPPAKK